MFQEGKNSKIPINTVDVNIAGEIFIEIITNCEENNWTKLKVSTSSFNDSYE